MNAIFRTETGNSENQDRGLIKDGGGKLVLCIADGAGGRSGGREAAMKAVQWINECAMGLIDTNACLNALQQLDDAIERDVAAGETTCVIAVVKEGHVYGASAGDSGAWTVRPSGIIDLTKHQVRKPFVGSGSICPVAFRNTCKHGDHLILATDGLLKYTSPLRIGEVCRLNEVEQIPDLLIGLVRSRSGALPDDTTVISLRI
jgi:serine/threonine protein phosphatase PrpC